MNETFKVRTLFDCEYIEDYRQRFREDPLWVQTVLGCRLLLVLQEMYGFNMTYIVPNTQFNNEDERALSTYPQLNDSIDIYARPLGLTNQLLEISCPIEAIFTWRYGFILKPPYRSILLNFYSLPFTRPVWNCLYFLVLLVSVIFFYLSRWEKKILGGYCSYHYELLLAVGACCLHILPLQANLLSRRIAYLSFILGVYVLNSFFSSNLLSHLVSDKDSSMDLETLANSDYEVAKLNPGPIPPIYNPQTQYTFYKMQRYTNTSMLQNKLSRAKCMTMVDGLNAVMTTRTALLTDYSVVHHVLSKMFQIEDICQLIGIDMYSNIKKYFYTSKNFSYADQFKIGILRVKETGILQRILLDDVIPSFNCAHTYPTSAEFVQILRPLALLLGSYVAATLIMFLERWHYQRNRVWPFVN